MFTRYDMGLVYFDPLTSIPLLLSIVSIVYLVMRVLQLTAGARPPTLHHQWSVNNASIIEACPTLTQTYTAPFLWGKSGHLQMVRSQIYRPCLHGEKHSVMLEDKTTITFDVFQPLVARPDGVDCTLLVCPGIPTNHRSHSVCKCVQHACKNGLRVAVLNHLGSQKDIRLTSPRVFTYGDSDCFGTMVDQIYTMYPGTVCIAVGFSMGGNIVLKYLGESCENQLKIAAAISVCNGYDIEQSLLQIEQSYLRRIYSWIITQKHKRLLRSHYTTLFGAESRTKYGKFDEDILFSASSMSTIDEVYSRRRAGFASRRQYYEWASSFNYMHKITTPLLLINARDDPIIPSSMFYVAEEHAKRRDNTIFAATEHGGHLAFFENGILYPDVQTWLDRVIVEYTNAAMKTYI